MVDIYIGSTPKNKRKVDADDSIEMIRQVMDIFDISIRVVDYSKSLKMPMTATNKEIFEGLGFVNSQFPYRRSYADVYVSGILIMQNAFVMVKESDKKEYSVSLISESKEIWKVVENNTLADLNLDDTAHTKSSALIKLQWENGLTTDAKFLYFLADYGGKIPSDNKVFGDYLVPSYRLSYLVDKINTKYSVNIVLPEFLDKTFITFSDANEIEESNDKIVFDKYYEQPIQGTDIERYKIVEDGIYELRIKGAGIFATYIDVFLGGFYHRFSTTEDLANFTSPDINLRKGEILSFAGSPNGWYFIGQIQIIRKAIDVSGNKAFQNYKITDFLKEIIYQSASIPIKTGNNYHFITLSEIVSNEASDWTSYFDSEENTNYIIGKYGQNNWLRYKYAEAEDANKDGLISIPNVNLDTNKDIIKSTLYNTAVNSIPFTLGGTSLSSQQYHLWKRTVEQKNGVFEERYQGQTGRMFLLTGIEYTTGSNFSIVTGSDTVTTNKLILANNEDYNFQKVINSRYREYSKILQNPEVKNAIFKIPLIEFASFDFKRRIYVAQLEGFFIINRIIFKVGELMKVELIKANITAETSGGGDTDPPEPNTLSMVFQSNMAVNKNIRVTNAQLVTEKILIIGDISGVSLELYVGGLDIPFTILDNSLTFQYSANEDIPFGMHTIIVNGVENTLQYSVENRNPGIEI